ncbi:MAG TPA: Ig-like domain-containing protein [Kofleriaceae bacterium]|nr:Ig-like domain-containing protein [Kofleriaceae bacterium]
MVEQVLMKETFTDSMGAVNQRCVFGFGTHPEADEITCNGASGSTVAHHVDSALVLVDAPGIRVIFGSLLIGNYLEEIECRQPVGPDGAFDKVPLGSTPDDIAKCAVPMDTDALALTCKGPHAVCLCQLPGGCNGIAEGLPVGVEDANQDGAADTHQMIKGAVGFKCTAGSGATATNVNVAIDQAQSYYDPSGFQQPPATGGFEAMGPALVLYPALVLGNSTVAALPSGSTCGLALDPDVVGKNFAEPCTPVDSDGNGGRPPECDDLNIDQCPQSCTPGDLSGFSFGTEPMLLSLQGITNGQMGVSRTADIFAVTFDNIPVNPNTIGTIQIFEGVAMTPYNMFTVSLTGASQMDIHFTNPTGLAANTQYTVTFPTGFQDGYGVPLPQAQSITFTTGS